MMSSKLPKRLSIAEVKQLLGDAAAERLLSAFMRKKASGVMSVTLDEVQLALKALSAEVKNGAATKALRKLAHKWIMESGQSKAAFARYLNQMLAVDTKKKGGRRAKTQK